MSVTPIQLIMTLSLTLILALAAPFFPIGPKVGEPGHSEQSFREAVETAYAAAPVSGGATIEVAPATSGGSTLLVYGGRPDGVGTYTLKSTITVGASVTLSGATSFAVFLTSAGEATAGAYVHGQSASAGMCTGSIPVVFGASTPQTLSLGCADPRLNS